MDIADGSAPRPLLTRLLEEPGLVTLVRGLDGRTLGRIIDHIGLEDAGEIVALATAEQLAEIFDEDLWRRGRAGHDETFDAERFGMWVQIMREVGENFAARKLAEMDEDLLTLGIFNHVLVVDMDVLASHMAERGQHDGSEDDLVDKALESSLSQELDEYLLIAQQPEGWDDILATLLTLDRDDHDLVHRILDRCCALSTDQIEESGGLYNVLTSRDMLESDVAASREDRRARAGFMAPSAATSFLDLARVTPLDDLIVSDADDPVTRAYFRTYASPMAGAPEPDGTSSATPSTMTTRMSAELSRLALGPDENLVPRLAPPVSRIEAEMRGLKDRDPATYAQRLSELNYLANVLISGFSNRERALRPADAGQLVLQVCDVGWTRLGTQEMTNAVRLFRIGWNVLGGKLPGT